MGIDTSAKVFLGLPREEFPDGIEGDDDFHDWTEEKELDSCSPYFDASTEDCLFGFDVSKAGRYHAKSFPWDQAMVDELRSKFVALVGKDPNLYISPHVT